MSTARAYRLLKKLMQSCKTTSDTIFHEKLLEIMSQDDIRALVDSAYLEQYAALGSRYYSVNISAFDLVYQVRNNRLIIALSLISAIAAVAACILPFLF